MLEVKPTISSLRQLHAAYPGGVVIDRLTSWLPQRCRTRDPGLPDTAERKVALGQKCRLVVIGIVTIAVDPAGRQARGATTARSSATSGWPKAEIALRGPRRSTIEFVTPDRVTYRPNWAGALPVGTRHRDADLCRGRQEQPESCSRAEP